VGGLPTKEFIIPLVETGYEESFHVTISHDGATVTRFCIAYVLTIGETQYQPCRINNAHGSVHMDVFDAQGERLPSEELPHMDVIETRDMVSLAREYLEDKLRFHRERILRELGLTIG
jgi:hypothetical protein